jgi:hypothetical protein
MVEEIVAPTASIDGACTDVRLNAFNCTGYSEGVVRSRLRDLASERLMDAQIVTLTVNCGSDRPSQVLLPVVSAS